ncbi:MAG: matrixin family metalloprotease [Nanoarchaeota archaeon]|nr:matrixin family metalloprotease [Nanoarchaeota archaeon]
MDLKQLFFGMLSLFLIFFIFTYWFMPFSHTPFKVQGSGNFSIGNESDEMQFYSNMRFPEKDISYAIDENCNLQRANNMIRAFEIMEEITPLNFYPSGTGGPEIEITCDEKSIPTGGGTFVAGEGGPTRIISGENFNIILSGSILLLRDSSCPRPNIHIHELLHVLGFDHSENENNIMYPISDCSQTIGDDIINKINFLYNYPPYPDLELKDVSAFMSGRYLSINLSVRNIGLKEANPSKLVIYSDNKAIKELDLDAIDISSAYNLEIRNVWVPDRQPKELKIKVETNEPELSLENNQVILKGLED